MLRTAATVTLTTMMAMATATATDLKVDKSGSFIDEAGRIRIFHGLNAVYKVAPFYPVFASSNSKACTADTTTTMCPEELTQLHDEWGMNALRLGVLWNAVMPAEGQINQTYLATVNDLIGQLAKANIYTLVDAHQDAMGAAFCGEVSVVGFSSSMNRSTHNITHAIAIVCASE